MTEPSCPPTESLTEAFYRWEQRGRGWQLWDEPVALEPAYRPLFLPRQLSPAAIHDDAHKPTFLSRLTDRMLGVAMPPAAETTVDDSFQEPDPELWDDPGILSELEVAVPADLEIGKAAAEQFLLSVPQSAGPVAFELCGDHEGVRLQFACAPEDESAVRQPLKAYFPGVLVSRESDSLARTWPERGEGEVVSADFGLAHEFMVPLRTGRGFEVDPLAGVVGTLAELDVGESSVLQIIFQRARAPWARESLKAVLDDSGSPFFIDAPEISALAKAKMARPLFACIIRIGVRASCRSRALSIARSLTGGLRTLADPLANELIPLEADENYPADEHARDILLRRSRRSGMLLSVEELVTLVHLPSRSVQSERLLRHGRKTKAAPAVATGAGVCLGQNVHDGKAVEVRTTPDQRSRHTYIIGASGTGKSTLLLNMVRQDLERGDGLAVFDPHGDLVDRIIELVPEQRLDDVILVDPGDGEYPIGFNILSAQSELEQTILASDLVTVFERLSTSWGDQMTSVLGNAILAFLENDRGGTLIDLRRFLVEDRFRKEILATVKDPDIVYYWEREFPMLRGKPQAPILTRLDTFLRPKPIRYIVAQKETRLDLRRVMDDGKILLCRLSHGAIGEENAYLLGTLLVSKLHQVAMSRQDTATENRRPFYLYIDEFHNFLTPSMASLLSGARKYRLGLILAHQDLRQLQTISPDILAAVLTNPCMRVCFRVGDDDARTLAKGFASFKADDLQSLGIGEAIARVERADFDFNLQTQPLPVRESELGKRRHEEITAHSRTAYGRPRAEVEASLRQPNEDQSTELAAPAVSKRSSAVQSQPRAADGGAAPVNRPPREPTYPDAVTPAGGQELPGRGGPQHRYLQELIRRWAEANGWRPNLEEEVLDGLGRVDVTLRKNELSIACEIAVTPSPGHELENLQKCLAGGFTRVVVVSPETKTLNRLKQLAGRALTDDQKQQALYCSPEELFAQLAALEAATDGSAKTVRGYRVKVRMKPAETGQQNGKRGAISAVIAKAMGRMRNKQ